MMGSGGDVMFVWGDLDSRGAALRYYPTRSSQQSAIQTSTSCRAAKSERYRDTIRLPNYLASWFHHAGVIPWDERQARNVTISSPAV